MPTQWLAAEAYQRTTDIKTTPFPARTPITPRSGQATSRYFLSHMRKPNLIISTFGHAQ